MSTAAIDTNRYRFIPGVTKTSDIDLDQEVVMFGGERYTEADAERDADWAEANPPQFRGLRRGGVSMSPDGEHSPKITFSLPDPDEQWLRQKAKAEGVSVSKWTRQLVQRERQRELVSA